MNVYTPVVTQEGINAAVSALEQGVKIQIGHIAVGDSGYTPDRNQTALKSQKNTAPVSGAEVVGNGQFHVTAEFTDDKQYAVKEVGFFLNDHADESQRTLFAVWSHPENVLFYQTPIAKIVQGFDLLLSAVPPDSLDFNVTGDLSLFYADDFAAMTIAQTQMATAQIESNLRQIKFNERLLSLGG
ncbi:phage tail protein [Pseudoalteromonas luteoviolacea]|uniref:phage tail-collar fiber domain-containing protein n=1 Tax=Pseudoalteromonas luteoviolacea TaxID=43657 RepID=UPI00114E5A7F|nr:phage tail protein [Pseudoalteromonas luteoviolacea]TQF71852.1 phage tail protein [Pseudoalteromonas luteoviolacea]